MAEGGLKAPVRHPVDWKNPDFYDAEKLDAELRRAFDICHGCRRCFNLCDSFPRLFDLVDESETGELDSVASEGFGPVVEACTLCDMCFMTKCPYVPPHEFNLDFPHLMLRARAVAAKAEKPPAAVRALTRTDRNGRLAGAVAPLANWASRRGNALTRPAMEKIAHVHRDAALPPFAGKSFEKQAAAAAPSVNRDAPAFGRRAVLYATCYTNWNTPEVGLAARAVLARNGVETSVDYPECCGMPQLEQGDIAAVADVAARVAAALRPHVEDGRDIIAMTPSCALMLKFEWPLLVPDSADVRALSKATFDLSEYVVDIARREGLADGLGPVDGPVSVHIACHARAQNMGRRAEDMLRLIPDVDLKVVERCSGHGGSWGVMRDTFEVGMKVGRPAFRQMANGGKARYIMSECPLAGMHIGQGIEAQAPKGPEGAAAPPAPEVLPHPIVLLARAWGLGAFAGAA